MAYQFRLETLLTVRRNLEELAQMKLANEMRLLAGHRKRKQELENSRAAFMDELENSKKGRMDSALYIFFMESMRSAELMIRSQNQVIESQRQVVEQAREALTEKVKSRKIIEKARERDYKKYLQEMLRLEYKENDEIISLRNGNPGLTP
ncbi:MAG: flagellar FliJ family protein [Proteobacteria bacterium]|nr:flagellar FliJ family protein [Pseudomonadota bacterium]MBU1737331.1 flagellar FliJ family protein [Pseudomonadota bacterium]